jgi:histidinol-phosphate aminotransferase
VVRAVADAAATMNRYPDMGCTSLYAALARRLAVEPQQLAAGTGSVAVLYHLLQAFCEPGDEVVYAWRSFEAYPIAVSVTGATSVQVPLTADARHDLEAMAAAVTDRTKVVVVCTPNNPTGPAVTHRQLADFVARVPPHVLVVVDEAYREFVRTDDPADPMRLLPQHPNLVVMRTFAKAYGLAGLRVGYLVAERSVATAVRACALPFGVS